MKSKKLSQKNGDDKKIKRFTNDKDLLKAMKKSKKGQTFLLDERYAPDTELAKKIIATQIVITQEIQKLGKLFEERLPKQKEKPKENPIMKKNIKKWEDE